MSSQSKIVVGKVVDSLNVPLENATIIASSMLNKDDFKFASSNSKGDFSLDLKVGISYKIAVSYIGFIDYAKEIYPEQQTNSLLIKLTPSTESLREIVIQYKVEPILIKKDTVVFDVSKFTNGNERKLKDQLQKLPGMQVSKNGTVTYQGKQVKATLVESGSFFGGSSKIAVENIPADAVDKIVLLDNFSEVDFMKQVEESGDLIMNVVLKKEKKKFAFGDITAGHSDNNYYKLHSNLFYYSPKRSLSSILDFNNNGTNTLEFTDVFRLESGIFSTYSKNKKKIDNNLFQFAVSNDRVTKTNGKFIAANYNEKINAKTSVETYFIYGASNNLMQNDYFIQYANNSNLNNETRNTLDRQNSDFILFNLKINTKPAKDVNIKYVLNLKDSNDKSGNNIISSSDLATNFFDTNNINESKSFNHFFEYNRKINSRKYQTFVINHAYSEGVIDKNWLSNAPFLQDYLPLQNDTSYSLNKDVALKTNSFDITYSSYWKPNSRNTFTISALADLNLQNVAETDRQVLNDNSFVAFDPNVFGNKIANKDVKISTNLEYKLQVKKWTNTFSFELENINRKFRNFDQEIDIQKVNFKPNYRSDYKFSEAHFLQFDYQFLNNLSSLAQLSKGLVINSFNSVYEGNDNLMFEQAHSFALTYNRRNVFKRYYFDLFSFYNRTNNPIRNGVLLSGINQSSQPIYINEPSDNFTFRGSFTKNLKNFDVILSSKLSILNYTQQTNDMLSVVNVNNNTFGITLKTNNVEWPQIGVGYEKGYNTYKSKSQTEYQSDFLFTDIEIELLDNLIFKGDYNYSSNEVNDSKNYYQLANAQLEYGKSNNPWLFNLGVTNVFNSKTINSNSISNYISAYSSTRILPRIAMLKATYKF